MSQLSLFNFLGEMSACLCVQAVQKKKNKKKSCFVRLIAVKCERNEWFDNYIFILKIIFK